MEREQRRKYTEKKNRIEKLGVGIMQYKRDRWEDR